MIGEALARRYATALFHAASNIHQEEEIGRHLSSIADLSRTNQHFQYFLLTAKIPGERKKALLRSMMGPEVSDLLINFLLIVMEKRRQKVLWQAAKIFWRLVDIQKGRLEVIIQTPGALGDQDRDAVKATLKQRLRKSIILKEESNAEILGGMTVRIGNRIVNGSVSGQLERLRKTLLQ